MLSVANLRTTGIAIIPLLHSNVSTQGTQKERPCFLYEKGYYVTKIPTQPQYNTNNPPQI